MNFVQPRVTLVALTQLAPRVDGYGFAAEEWLSLNVDDVGEDSGFFDSDFLMEFGGRGCYEAWNRSNPATNTNEKYAAHILNVGHTSLFGHASASFYVTGVSRALTHELVRHRFLVFSQRSQRFVDESNCDFVCPPLLEEPEHAHLRAALLRSVQGSRADYTYIADALVEAGVPRKQAREAARAALPECTETRLLVSGNIRGWRDFIVLRDADGVDAEMRNFAQLVLAELRKRVAPASLQGLGTEERGSG